MNKNTFSYKKLRESSQHKAFTLAEVLITLGIIGIVAAVTIPTLMNKTQDAEYKTAYKKAFSTASQAWMKAIADGNITSRPSWLDRPTRISNFNAFKANFEITKDCDSNNNSECWANGEHYHISFPDANALAFIDKSGMAWSICSITISTGADLLVDTNGNKGPNKFGQDRFLVLPISSTTGYTGFPDKIIPFGADCTSTTSCGGASPSEVCPSYARHPCYYTGWLYE